MMKRGIVVGNVFVFIRFFCVSFGGESFEFKGYEKEYCLIVFKVSFWDGKYVIVFLSRVY